MTKDPDQNAGPGLKDRLMAFFRDPDAVSPKHLTQFTRQFATLISAGVPIVRGLTVLQKQAPTPAFKATLGRVREDIEAGLSITEALSKHPKTFPKLYVAMVRAGEAGGILDTILDRLSSFLESSEALKAKVKSAMMYPVVVLSICAGVTVFLMVFVIPRFQVIFAGFGRELPFITQLLIDISAGVKRFFVLILLAPAAGWYGFKKYYATPGGQRFVDAKLLQVPLFGPIIQKAVLARWTRTLATLAKSGVPALQALETSADTADNTVIADAVRAARDSIKDGGTLSAPLEKSGLFPDMVVSMVATGEETGSLDTMLSKVADFYEAEVDTDVKGLASMIEPIVIVLMGLIVGAIVVAMFLPILDIPGATGG
ncbi:MAG: type II secretion system F family protein [Elusimicrobia bacterium]|nr:type II secretion system F family protein [Elusimicrobiota bacterium]